MWGFIIVLLIILSIVLILSKTQEKYIWSSDDSTNYLDSRMKPGTDKRGYYFPYYYKYGGGLPRNLFTQQRLRTPGFYVNSLMWDVRPGINNDPMASNAWARDNDSYYYINNSY